MTIDDIYNLPVQNIADENCILFLWVTFPLLQEGLETIKRWGFTYKTCAFNWVKRNKKSDNWFWGLGYWTRSNSELCLLATRGCPPGLAVRFIKYVMRELCVIVRNQVKYEIELLNSAGMYQELNYLPENRQMVG